jgi:hypothetical protein
MALLGNGTTKQLTYASGATGVTAWTWLIKLAEGGDGSQESFLHLLARLRMKEKKPGFSAAEFEEDSCKILSFVRGAFSSWFALATG